MADKLGLIAGGGALPRRLAEICRSNGREVFIVALHGQTDAATVEGFPHLWASMGQVGAIINWLHGNGVRDLVFFGPVRRPSLSDLKPDWRAAKILASIGFRALGDDGIMRTLARILEDEERFRVVGAHQLWADLLLAPGVPTAVRPDAQAEADIARGLEVARALGAVDVGQSVVVQQGLVLGVEAIEGTDALVRRCGGLRRGGPGGVLVKLVKPQQDHRLDLPTIGPDTVEEAAAAGLRGIAARAGGTLVVDFAGLIEAADRHGLFIVGLEIGD
ncbi:MAG TPA: UDP-2,3-diacylglucosamine diphosphatase LpxI [Azospirillaceae bacterium]|nr:UDP-2,3-diacylglucosamine diphosphatase LpxI [Azospirillaceae bacterium]